MDCAVRQVVADRATAILSGRAVRPSDWTQLRSSLTSDALCPAVHLAPPPPPPMPSPPVLARGSNNSLPQLVVDADPSNLTAALAQARLVLRDAPTVRLQLRGGLYQLQAPLELGPADSGLSIAAAADEETPVILSAGRRLHLRFHRVAEPSTPDGAAMYVASVPSELAQATQVYRSDGTRLVRARWPNGNPEHWTADGGNAWASPTGSIPKHWDSGHLVKLASPVDPLHIPQGSDSLQAFSVLVGGPASIYAGGRNPAGETYPGGGVGGLTVDAATAARARNWSTPPSRPELTVHGLWGSYAYELAGVDGASLHFGKGGSHLTTGCSGGDFIVENTLAE